MLHQAKRWLASQEEYELLGTYVCSHSAAPLQLSWKPCGGKSTEEKAQRKPMPHMRYYTATSLAENWVRAELPARTINL